MSSDLIKPHHHSCPYLATDPKPLAQAKMQGSAAATVTFWKLPQMKESRRIIFCLSCPYLILAPVCFKLQGRPTLQGIGGVVEERGRQMEMEIIVGVLQIIQRLVCWATTLYRWCAILQKGYLLQCIAALMSFYLESIFSHKLHCF